MSYFVDFFMLPGVVFSNGSMTFFSFNSGAKRFLPAAIVSMRENFLAPFKLYSDVYAYHI